MRHDEDSLQMACVRWFDLQHPGLSPLLFHVPNGGHRNAREAGRFKAMGVRPGVADLILLVPKRVKVLSAFPNEAWWHTIPALCIELKTAKGVQRKTQREWQSKVEAQGYKYVVIRSVEQFISEVEAYLSQ